MLYGHRSWRVWCRIGQRFGQFSPAETSSKLVTYRGFPWLLTSQRTSRKGMKMRCAPELTGVCGGGYMPAGLPDAMFRQLRCTVFTLPCVVSSTDPLAISASGRLVEVIILGFYLRHLSFCGWMWWKQVTVEKRISQKPLFTRCLLRYLKKKEKIVLLKYIHIVIISNKLIIK